MTPPEADPPRPAKPPVAVGRITRPHGVRGELRVEMFGGSEVLRSQRHVLVGGQPRAVESLRPAGDGWVLLRLSGVADRTAAEQLRDAEIAVPRDAFPPAGEGEAWHHDLLGAEVVDRAGRVLGRSVAVVNYGASDLLVVEGPDGEWMIPWIEGVVVSVEPGRIEVDPPDGLEPSRD